MRLGFRKGGGCGQFWADGPYTLACGPHMLRQGSGAITCARSEGALLSSYTGCDSQDAVECRHDFGSQSDGSRKNAKLDAQSFDGDRFTEHAEGSVKGIKEDIRLLSNY